MDEYLLTMERYQRARPQLIIPTQLAHNKALAALSQVQRGRDLLAKLMQN